MIQFCLSFCLRLSLPTSLFPCVLSTFLSISSPCPYPFTPFRFPFFLLMYSPQSAGSSPLHARSWGSKQPVFWFCSAGGSSHVASQHLCILGEAVRHLRHCFYGKDTLYDKLPTETSRLYPGYHLEVWFLHLKDSHTRTRHSVWKLQRCIEIIAEILSKVQRGILDPRSFYYL